MKISEKKKIVVKCGKFWMDEYEIDSEIFDDVYMESATRAVEKRKNVPGFKVTIVFECWEKKDFKKPDKHYCYNTYHVFINAGLHKQAEALRTNFLKSNGYDMKFQSIKEENGNQQSEYKSNQPESGSTEY